MSAVHDVCIIGGAGHIGAPLAILLAAAGRRVLIVDRNKEALAKLAAGRMPFLEKSGETILQRVLREGALAFSTNAEDCKNIAIIIITIGTPIDEYQNPVFRVLTECIDELLPYLDDQQTIILRSTVPPGATEFIDCYLRSKGRSNPVAFCPERVTQGNAIEEIRELPQLISGTNAAAIEAARRVFSAIAPDVIEMTAHEAEFAKLITNAFRYITFAAANQLYCLVETAGIDFNALLLKMKQGYPRMASFASPGFSAGPCLMKDTMQLLSFAQDRFSLGREAVRINESLPNFLVERLARKTDLRHATVGILGMAFKGNSDDIRDSLAYKLRKILQFHSARIFCSDEYVADPTFLTKEEIIKEAEVLIVAAPHDAYRSLRIPAGKIIEDVWNVLPKAQ